MPGEPTAKRMLVTSAGGGVSNNLMEGLRTCSSPVFLAGTSIDSEPEVLTAEQIRSRHRELD